MARTPNEWRELMQRRVRRLGFMLANGAPDRLIAREVFMVEQAMRQCLDDDQIDQARFEILVRGRPDLYDECRGVG